MSLSVRPFAVGVLALHLAACGQITNDAPEAAQAGTGGAGSGGLDRGGSATAGGIVSRGGLSESGGDQGTGGAQVSGGATSGGTLTGGLSPTGGLSTTGGFSTGGISTGGSSSGGLPSTGGLPWVTDDCPDSLPSALVALPAGFSIDATEVTRGQYQTWLKTGPATDGQIADCAWNTSFVPDSFCMSGKGVYQGVDPCNHPQVCIDWCDAYAYCLAQGKRLCGKIGGGTNALHDHANASLSQWDNACTSGGTYWGYPYGNGYSRGVCNGEMVIGMTVPVGTMPSCQSSVPGYQGVYDLSGNADEWEDCCEGAGETGTCFAGGGYYGEAEDFLQCGTGGYSLRPTVSMTRGFRCCSG
jgi:sulfatase modifying factor 1